MSPLIILWVSVTMIAAFPRGTNLTKVKNAGLIWVAAINHDLDYLKKQVPILVRIEKKLNKVLKLHRKDIHFDKEDTTRRPKLPKILTTTEAPVNEGFNGNDAEVPYVGPIPLPPNNGFTRPLKPNSKLPTKLPGNSGKYPPELGPLLIHLGDAEDDTKDNDENSPNSPTDNMMKPKLSDEEDFPFSRPYYKRQKLSGFQQPRDNIIHHGRANDPRNNTKSVLYLLLKQAREDSDEKLKRIEEDY